MTNCCRLKQSQQESCGDIKILTEVIPIPQVQAPKKDLTQAQKSILRQAFERQKLKSQNRNPFTPADVPKQATQTKEDEKGKSIEKPPLTIQGRPYLPKTFDTQYSVRKKRNPMFGPAKFQNNVSEHQVEPNPIRKGGKKQQKNTYSNYGKQYYNTYQDTESSLFKDFQHFKK